MALARGWVARAGGRPWHSDPFSSLFARAVGKGGSSVVSDRLDIVRLIDARVTSTRRTVTRSKQLAEAAKGDLHIHEDWLRQHNERFGHDRTRQQRRRPGQRTTSASRKQPCCSCRAFVPGCVAAWSQASAKPTRRFLPAALGSGERSTLSAAR